MTELGELYAVFLVLYLLECLTWVPRRTIAFTCLGHRWRGRAAFRPNSGWASSVALGTPWPPLTPAFLSEPLPFAVEPDAITATESDGRRLAWEDAGPIVARGPHLEVGESLSCKLASRRSAAQLAEALERVRLAKPKNRESELRRLLDARFAAESLAARRKEFASSVWLLRASSNALWAALFGGLGAAVLAQNMLFLLAAAGLTAVLWPINGMIFARTLRRQCWLPRAQWPDLPSRLVVLLSPLSGVRAVDSLARALWADLDPLTVAATLLSPGDLADFARPRLVALEPRGDDHLVWWRREVRRRMEALLAARGISVSDLLAPPPPESEHVRWYCPACLAQYANLTDPVCQNESCGGVDLRAFARQAAPGPKTQGEP